MISSATKIDDVIAQFASDATKTVINKDETFALVKFELEGEKRYFCFYIKGDRWRTLEISNRTVTA